MSMCITTILFMFWTITNLGKKLAAKSNSISEGSSIAILGRSFMNMVLGVLKAYPQTSLRLLFFLFSIGVGQRVGQLGRCCSRLRTRWWHKICWNRHS